MVNGPSYERVGAFAWCLAAATNGGHALAVQMPASLINVVGQTALAR